MVLHVRLFFSKSVFGESLFNTIQYTIYTILFNVLGSSAQSTMADCALQCQ